MTGRRSSSRVAGISADATTSDTTTSSSTEAPSIVPQKRANSTKQTAAETKRLKKIADEAKKAEAKKAEAERAEAERLEAERLETKRAEAKRVEELEERNRKLEAEVTEMQRLKAELAEMRRLTENRIPQGGQPPISELLQVPPIQSISSEEPSQSTPPLPHPLLPQDSLSRHTPPANPTSSPTFPEEPPRSKDSQPHSLLPHVPSLTPGVEPSFTDRLHSDTLYSAPHGPTSGLPYDVTSSPPLRPSGYVSPNDLLGAFDDGDYSLDLETQVSSSQLEPETITPDPFSSSFNFSDDFDPENERLLSKVRGFREPTAPSTDPYRRTHDSSLSVAPLPDPIRPVSKRTPSNRPSTTLQRHPTSDSVDGLLPDLNNQPPSKSASTSHPPSVSSEREKGDGKKKRKTRAVSEHLSPGQILVFYSDEITNEMWITTLFRDPFLVSGSHTEITGYLSKIWATEGEAMAQRDRSKWLTLSAPWDTQVSRQIGIKLGRHRTGFFKVARQYVAAAYDLQTHSPGYYLEFNRFASDALESSNQKEIHRRLFLAPQLPTFLYRLLFPNKRSSGYKIGVRDVFLKLNETIFCFALAMLKVGLEMVHMDPSASFDTGSLKFYYNEFMSYWEQRKLATIDGKLLSVVLTSTISGVFLQAFESSDARRQLTNLQLPAQPPPPMDTTELSNLAQHINNIHESFKRPAEVLRHPNASGAGGKRPDLGGSGGSTAA